MCPSSFATIDGAKQPVCDEEAAIQPLLSDDDVSTPCKEDKVPESICMGNGVNVPHSPCNELPHAQALHDNQQGTEPTHMTRWPHGLGTVTWT